MVIIIRKRKQAISNFRLVSSSSSAFVFPSSPHDYILSLYSAQRQVHSFCQSKFSRQSDLVVPLSIASIFPLPCRHPVAAYPYFLVFTSLPPLLYIFPSVSCFSRHILSDMRPISYTFLHFILCRIRLCNSYSVLT